MPLRTLTTLTILILRLPWQILLSLPRSTRPHAAWSIRQSLGTSLLSTLVRLISLFRLHTPLPSTPGKEGPRWITIPFVSSWNAKYVGRLEGAEEGVKPKDVGATWYPASLRAEDVEGKGKEEVLVVLHIHGGAYVIGDGRTANSGYMLSLLHKHTPATHVLAPQYRLSKLQKKGGEGNPFPAALQDALTSYLYLLNTLGIPPSRIVLSGDSAGANCAIALLRYISEHGSALDIPAPRAALLWSPWVDPTDAREESVTRNPNYATDYLSHAFIEWGVKAFTAGRMAVLKTDPYVNVGVEGFKTEVPLYVNVGGAEILLGAGRRWAEMMERVEGNTVVFDVEENVPHDVMLVAPTVGFKREAVACAKRAGEWLEGLKV